MILSYPWADSIDIIDLKPVKKIPGIKPMGITTPWAVFIYIIALQPVKNVWELTQWDLVYLGLTILILLPYIHLK